MADTTENPNEETIKCVVVGDNNVGKTRLICSRAYNESSPNNRCFMNTSHVPTVWAIDQYRNNEQVLQNARCDVDGTLVSLRLWDTFGDHHKDRRFAYGKADVVVICFSVCDKKSLEQVQRFWMPEVRKHCKNIPVFTVACKVDLRFADLGKLNKSRGVLSKAIRGSDILYPDHCRTVLEPLNCPYYESSVLIGHGIHDVFENVCRAALIHRRSLYFWNSGLKRIQRPYVQEPLEPPKPKAPELNVIHEDTNPLPNLYSLYSSQMFADIVFVCQEEKIYAHKTIIAASSNVFWNLLNCLQKSEKQTVICLDKENCQPSQSLKDTSINDEDPFSSKLTHKRRSSSDVTVTNKLIKCELPIIVLSEPDVQYCGTNADNMEVFNVNLPPQIFKIVTEFCYTGCLTLGTEKVNTTNTIDVLTQVIVASQRFGLTSLMKIAAQIINSDAENLTDDLSKEFLVQRSQRLRELFLNNECWSDVVFAVDDGHVYGHKILLCSGCDVMNAMLAGTFIESKDKQVDLPFATTKSLQAVLGYIYASDLSELNDCMDEDFGEVISLANRFCLPDLVALVEGFVVKLFMKHENQHVKSGDAVVMTKLCEEVLWMLEMSQMHNAPRLHEWCLHFLCVHYNEACRSVSKLMKSLPDETQKYLVEHRWPPVWYIKQKDAYEKMLSHRRNEECQQRAVRKPRK